ncbi:hypothetical protein AALB39_15715 [Lachnospiraceae bacterium 54-53]
MRKKEEELTGLVSEMGAEIHAAVGAMKMIVINIRGAEVCGRPGLPPCVLV